MRQFSMWWIFLFAFALFIGAIQSLGWWTRTASAQAPVAQSTPSSGERCHACETMHWRAMVMHK